MTTTPRSLAVGLGAWCLAFLTAYFGNINPVHLTPVGIVVLASSLMIGILAVRFGVNRFCRSASEAGAAVMTFACSWFVGIYAPITAIAANAPFYAWEYAQQVKTRADDLDPRLVHAIENTAATNFWGVAILLIVGYFVMKQTRKSIDPAHRFTWKLHWVDGVFGITALLIGFAGIAFGLGLKLTKPVQVGASVGGAFLLCFLFRSLRLQGAALKTQSQTTEIPSLPRKTSVLCVTALAIGLGSSGLLAALAKLSDFFGFSICILVLLTPWLIYRRGRAGLTDVITARSHQMNHFAVRCGIWFWLACSMTICGLCLPGIAESEINKSGTIATPFAWVVLSLKPIYCISTLPAGGAILGTLIVVWFLPRWTTSSEKILACAQAGAAGIVASYVFSMQFALSLMCCMIPAINTLALHQPGSLQSHDWMSEGRWSSLAGFNLLVFYAVAAAGASFWAAEATVECGLEWVIDRIFQKRRQQRND